MERIRNFTFKNRYSFVIAAFCVILSAILFAGAAFANEPYLFITHQTRCDLVKGKTAYGSEKFNWVCLMIPNVDKTTKGTLTITDGSYSYGTWNDAFNFRDGKKISNATHTFDLAYSYGSYNSDTHTPTNSKREELVFWGAADGGLSEKPFTFTLGDITVDGKIPHIRSSSEQKKSYAPYVEYVLDPSGNVTEIGWRFVNPKKPSVALEKSDEIAISKVDMILIWNNGKYLRNVAVNRSFADGEELSGSAQLNAPINPRDIGGIEIRFRGEGNTPECAVQYRWSFGRRDR